MGPAHEAKVLVKKTVHIKRHPKTEEGTSTYKARHNYSEIVLTK